MKFRSNIILGFVVVTYLMVGCTKDHNSEHHEDKGHSNGESEVVHFTKEQFNALTMHIDTLPMKNVSAVVHTNGQLEVSPQNEAIVTAIIGANVSAINVFEGQNVRKGQVLGYLSHPNLTRIQNDYLEAYNRLQFLEQEHQRQKRLYEEEVGSGKTFQQIQSDYSSAKGAVRSLESQLRQLGIKPQEIREGDFYDRVPIVSPIKGSVVKVGVKIGQYAQPEKELFEIINTDHIHADLMIFESDVHKIKKGQIVRLRVQALPNQDLYAKIYSIGKKFEEGPKAIHIHAEIENISGSLIPGMYIKGEVLMGNSEVPALPEGAVAREGDRHFAFLADKEGDGWRFTPIEVIAGDSDNEWLAVNFLQKVPEGSLFAMNNAYYLLAEMTKGEVEHDH